MKEWVQDPLTGRWYIIGGYSYSLTRSWSCSPGLYPDSDTATLTSKSFDLTGLDPEVLLTFWNAYYFEDSYDFGYVEYSIDGGVTWIEVLSVTGEKYYWTKQEVTLDSVGGEANFKIRFKSVSDDSVRKDGWYIDEIKLSGNLAE